jgi:hypothetical protein
MGQKKKHDKLVLVKKHRMNQYLHILDKLIDGKAEPAEVAERWRKFKELPK